jgi:hypothetical protein
MATTGDLKLAVDTERIGPAIKLTTVELWLWFDLRTF